MTIARVNSSGWGIGDELTSAQINALDIDHTYPVDGHAGGTFTPSAPIILGGSGLQLTTTTHQVNSGGRLTVKSGGEIRWEAGSTPRFDEVALFNLGATFGDVVTCNDDITFNGLAIFSGTSRPYLASRSLTRLQKSPTCLSHDNSGVSDWKGTGATQTTRVVGAVAVYDLDLPDGCTLTGVSVGFAGPSTDVGLPGTKPLLAIVKRRLTTGVQSTIASASDSSPDVGTYLAFHLNAVSAMSEVVDRTAYRYCAVLTTESGDGSNAGANIYDCQATFTTTSMDDGAG